jgi:GT2 family glycosyltransferase
MNAKPLAFFTAQKALRSYLDRMGRPGRIEEAPCDGTHRVRYTIRGNPRVSIVIPSAGKQGVLNGRSVWFVVHCVESIRRKTTYQNLEILVIDNDDMPEMLERKLDQLGVVRIPFTEAFNLSDKLNLGVAKAEGEYVILLNDDMEIISPDWVESMLEFAQWPEIGAVGAKLLFGDGRIQHSGVTFLKGHLPIHHFYGVPSEHVGYMGGNVLHRNYSGVTGACLMVRTDVYHELGGFDPAFPLNYNDMDFCMKLLRSGRRIVYQPFAELYHFEGVSKEGTFEHELKKFIDRWGNQWSNDPMYNINLSQREGDYRIGLDG